MKHRILPLAIAMAYLTPALAQTPAPRAPAKPDEAGTGAQKLETVVVTGTRTERRLQEVPGSISVVGEKQLERSQPQYLGDEGYLRLTAAARGAAERLADAIEAMPALRLRARPEGAGVARVQPVPEGRGRTRGDASGPQELGCRGAGPPPPRASWRRSDVPPRSAAAAGWS